MTITRPLGTPATVTIANCTITGNEAGGGGGGNGGNGFGGGIYLNNGATVSVPNSTSTNYKAVGGAVSGGGTKGLGEGVGVYNFGTFSFDVFTVIAHNHASTSNDDIFP